MLPGTEVEEQIVAAISGDAGNSAAGFRWLYRMFSYDQPTSTSINAPMGQHIPRLKIHIKLNHFSFTWTVFKGNPN